MKKINLIQKGSPKCSTISLPASNLLVLMRKCYPNLISYLGVQLTPKMHWMLKPLYGIMTEKVWYTPFS